MCMGSTPSAPPPPPKAPEAPRTPDGDSVQSGNADVRRRRALSGRSNSSTILTSSRGAVGDSSTASKTLLGQ